MQEFLVDLWQKISDFVGPLAGDIVFWISRFTGLPEKYALWVVLGFVIYISFLLFFGIFHKKIYFVWKKKIVSCTYEFDRIWYLVSKAMYDYNERLKSQGQTGQLVHGTRTILNLKNKEYLDNKSKIFGDVQKLETFLKKEIVPKKTMKKINFLQGKIVFWNLFQKIVGRGLTVFTLGLYYLSWRKLDTQI